MSVACARHESVLDDPSRLAAHAGGRSPALCERLFSRVRETRGQYSCILRLAGEGSASKTDGVRIDVTCSATPEQGGAAGRSCQLPLLQPEAYLVPQAAVPAEHVLQMAASEHWQATERGVGRGVACAALLGMGRGRNVLRE